jgi:taurine dioxygenase
MAYDLSQYRLIEVTPATGHIGAEIQGVDIGHGISDAQFAEIRRAFLNHHVLFFQDQQLDPQSLAAFGERFAPLCLTPYAKPMPDHPFVTKLVRSADVSSRERNVGDRWHSDQSPREHPSFGFALYCLEAPPYGGDTLFASLTAAYDSLSDGMKALCDDIIAIHSPSGVFGYDGMGGGGTRKPLIHKGRDGQYRKIDDETLAIIRAETEHPLVCIHPETGRRYLYATGDYMIRLKGMTELESTGLIEQLNRHVTRPEFTCRFRWRKGAVAILDNRCTQHYAVNDYEGFERAMLRIEMEGGRPFGPAMTRAKHGDDAVATPQQETSHAL